MKFRTEIGHIETSFTIGHSDRIALIGSCFADNIGEALCRDGFDAVHNPLGPLFNPESIGRILSRKGRPYGQEDFIEYQGVWHCLDFANRFQDASPEALAKKINEEYIPYAEALEKADILIVTLGNTKVYRHQGITAGNCHKLPGTMFEEHRLTIPEIEKLIPLLKGRKAILTLSPVRYPGEGLPAGSLAKATLRVAIDNICREAGSDYFPAFEILNDDLRDYRFYAPDMRHPSETAVEYVYEKFADAYFTDYTKQKSIERRKAALHASHRPIIS